MKQIIYFPNYSISNLGFVINNKTQKEIKSFLNKSTGYLHINLYDNEKKPITKQIHRLVAIHFIENPENKRCVNHIDSNRLNNNYLNLEWNTYKENNKHAYVFGFKKAPWLGIKRSVYNATCKNHR